ncbi:hypothetical protein WJX81_007699 [Elliptochloris bilobata]|uniref:B30.2/SPRY domain-containing protein n=1 Tax=Elliptochloris bilobata TaxID=381761 RepID=A0AAW1RCG4_9CHLO
MEAVVHCCGDSGQQPVKRQVEHPSCEDDEADEAIHIPVRSKKGRKRARTGTTGELTAEELVRVVPVPRRSELLLQQQGWRPVQLSKADKAPEATLSEDRLSVTSAKGFRTARTTHGAWQGTWYFEVRVAHLGASGHCRVGWSTRKGELHAPVGYDMYSYGYRDIGGCKVHNSLREDFGSPWAEGDVIGCLLHMPEGGQPHERDISDVVTWKGQLFFEDKAEPEPPALAGSLVAFSLNGALQGVAYRGIHEGTYYPAVSLFTLPQQAQGATVTCNFGPTFAHAPPEVEGCGPASPASELAGSPDAPGVAPPLAAARIPADVGAGPGAAGAANNGAAGGPTPMAS